MSKKQIEVICETGIMVPWKNLKNYFMLKFDGRFKELFFLKLFNLPAKNAKNINSFLISSFKKFRRFLSEMSRRFYFLNFSEVFKMTTKNGINQNFRFFTKNDGRFEIFYFLKKNNLLGKNRKNRNFFFYFDLNKLFIFLRKNSGRFNYFEFLKFSNLRVKMN